MGQKEIVLATDFSDAAADAATYAKELADQVGGSFSILHVFDGRVIESGPYRSIPGASTAWMEKYVEESREQGRKTLDGFFEELGATGERYFLEGKASEKIVEFSKDHNVYVLVMGTHGYSGIDRVWLGSVSEYVVRHAHCPVLTVKAKNK